MSRTHSADTPLALGWALNTSELPPESTAMVLLMMVAVGLVVGVIEAMRPMGAISVSIIPSSPVLMIGSRSSGPGVRVATRRFLRTLSSTRPRPVSSWAMAARRLAAATIAWRIEATTATRISEPRRRYSSPARSAAATAWSTVA